MKTFVFLSKNSSVIISLSAYSLKEAQEEINNLVNSTENDFRCEDNDGEDEDDSL